MCQRWDDAAVNGVGITLGGLLIVSAIVVWRSGIKHGNDCGLGRGRGGRGAPEGAGLNSQY